MNLSKKGIKLTNQEFDSKLNKQFIRLTEYINTNISLKIICIICNTIYSIKPKLIKNLKCNCQIINNTYSNKIKLFNIINIEIYKNINTELIHLCLTCNTEFINNPKNIFRLKNHCPKCSLINKSIKHINKLPNDIILIDDYINSFHKTLYKCKKCNFQWKTKPYYISDRGCGCPKCSKSKGERKIIEILDKYNINYTEEYFIKINNKSYYFDFYLIEYNTIIEYDGIQHFNYFNIVKINDNIKNEWCSNNNINMIRISYLDNIENKLSFINP